VTGAATNPPPKPRTDDELVRPIVADDEFNHEPYGAPDWRENNWTTWFDARNELRGIVYQNLQPAMPNGFALVMLYHRDRPLMAYSNPRIPWSECSHEQRIAGPVTFECLEPFGRWRVRVKTDSVDLDLTWHPEYHAYDWDWGEGTQSRHYEQFVRVEGRLQVGDERWDVDGLGQRDHAWGHRDPALFTQAWSARAFFGPGDSQLTTIVTTREETFMFGYVLRDGEARLIDRVDIHRVDAYSGGPPLATELRAFAAGKKVIDQQVRLESAISNAKVDERGESRQHFTFSEFADGTGRATVGQLDYWWAAPLPTEPFRTAQGNRGRWIVDV
jgi:hypothetical protein